MLMWAWRNWIAWVTVGAMVGIILVSFTAEAQSRLLILQICWLVDHSVALRFFVLFIGVMSCLYAIVGRSSPLRMALIRSSGISSMCVQAS